MLISKRFFALLQLALSALGARVVPLRETQDAPESQPEGFDVRGPLVTHKKRVDMGAPGALEQTRVVPLDQYEGPLKWARLRREGIDPQGER